MMSHRSLAAVNTHRSGDTASSASLRCHAADRPRVPAWPRVTCICILVSLSGTALLCPRALAATDWGPLASVLASGGAGRQSSVLRTGGWTHITSATLQLTFIEKTVKML